MVGFVVWKSNTKADDVVTVSSYTDSADIAGPLDSIAAAEIATSVAYAVDLPQAGTVSERAQTFAYQGKFAIDEEVTLAKPQIVAGGSLSKSDITTYTTVEGDTVSSLASKFNVTSDSIKWSNDLTSDRLAAGRVLYIPPSNQNGVIYTVKSGDTPESLASKYKTTADKIIRFNDAEVSGLVAGDRIFVPDGKIDPPAPVFAASFTSSYVFGTPIFGGGGYTPGQCTFGAANKRAQMGRPIPSNWGSAYTWDEAARAQGYRVDKSPEVGAIMQSDGNENPRFFYIYHVGVVVNVDAEYYYVYDMNFAGPWSERVHKFPLSSAAAYDFIH